MRIKAETTMYRQGMTVNISSSVIHEIILVIYNFREKRHQQCHAILPTSEKSHGNWENKSRGSVDLTVRKDIFVRGSGVGVY